MNKRKIFICLCCLYCLFLTGCSKSEEQIGGLLTQYLEVYRLVTTQAVQPDTELFVEEDRIYRVLGEDNYQQTEDIQTLLTSVFSEKYIQNNLSWVLEGSTPLFKEINNELCISFKAITNMPNLTQDSKQENNKTYYITDGNSLLDHKVSLVQIGDSWVIDAIKSNEGKEIVINESDISLETLEKEQQLAVSSDQNASLYYLEKDDATYSPLLIRLNDRMFLYDWKTTSDETNQPTIEMLGNGSFVGVHLVNSVTGDSVQSDNYLIHSETLSEIPYRSPDEIVSEEINSSILPTEHRIDIGWYSFKTQLYAKENGMPKDLLKKVEPGKSYAFTADEESIYCDVPLYVSPSLVIGNLRIRYEYDGSMLNYYNLEFLPSLNSGFNWVEVVSCG